MMMILTLLLSLAVLALFVQSSGAWTDKQRVDISKGGRRAASKDVRSRGKSGDFKSEGKRSDNHKSSYSAHLKTALSVEDDEEDGRLQYNQNTHAVENHAVAGLESRDSRFSFEETGTRLNLEGGAWRSQKADGSIEYMAFENKYTYKRVVREASGNFDCGRHIYDQRRKNKNPSILYSSYFEDIPQATLIHKITDNMFLEEFVFNNMNFSWTREASIPSDFRCYTASYEIAEESIGEMDQSILTWMGQDAGLYAAVERDSNGKKNSNFYWSRNVTVISELDGYTKTEVQGILPQNSEFRFVVASFNNTFWTTKGWGEELMQSNTNTIINVGFQIKSATALSESVLFLADEDNGIIVKYDIVNNEVLATSSGYIDFDYVDLAISLDKKYVYHANDDGIVALNATDLSFYRKYSMSLPGLGEYGIRGIEVTPTNMWIVVTDWNANKQSYLVSVTLNDY